MRRKMLFTIFKSLFIFVPGVYQFLISQGMMSYTEPNFDQIWWKRYLSLILCSKILLNVLHNLSLTILLPWQHTGFQTSPILKAFLVTFGIPFANGASYTGYTKHINMLAWALFTVFSSWKSLLKWSGWGLEKSELPWEQNVL